MQTEALTEIAEAARQMVQKGGGEMTPPMAHALAWIGLRFSGAADIRDVDLAVDADTLINILLRGGWIPHEASAVANIIVEKRFGDHPNEIPPEQIYAEYEADMAKLQEMLAASPSGQEGAPPADQPSPADGS